MTEQSSPPLNRTPTRAFGKSGLPHYTRQRSLMSLRYASTYPCKRGISATRFLMDRSSWAGMVGFRSVAFVHLLDHQRLTTEVTQSSDEVLPGFWEPLLRS